MPQKEKIHLTQNQETLLIPLLAKARAGAFFDDEKARQILAGIDYDFARLRVPKKTILTLCMRARKLDEVARDFIQIHANAVLLHLGCGLDSRCLRVPRANTLWFDLDLPDVIALRRKFYPETDTYRMIASSVSDLSWTERVFTQGRRVLVVAEGLLMYLSEAEVRALVVHLHQKFPGAHLAFDAFSRLAAQRVGAHPSLRKTGAAVQWGIDNPDEIEEWAPGQKPGIRLKEEWFFSQSPIIEQMDPLYRLLFRLSARIPAAQRAHRILYYRL